MQKTLPIHFAPLQGYTDVIYRNAHAACFGGIDTYYTPFVRLEKGGFRHRDVRGIEPGNNQVPHLIPQLIAPSFEKAEKILSLLIEKGYKEVDINMGCPFPMLAKRHNGSGILPYPEEVQALLSWLITEYPQISFSIKMRLGWEDPEECLKLAPIINELPYDKWLCIPAWENSNIKEKSTLKRLKPFRESANIRSSIMGISIV